MDWLHMPPLASLRAFSAFAEAGNVVDAGAALNVSHAAISQQLRRLEKHLGVALLDRSGRALVMTEQGQRLSEALALGFGSISAVLQELTGADAARPLHISTTPTFAANWLMPRLQDFQLANPAINLMVDPSPELMELSPGGIDVALRHGVGNWPGLHAEWLVAAPLVVVAAPELVAGRRIADPSDLTDLPWLQELGASESTRWLQRQGVARDNVGNSVQVPGNLMLDGARNGQGVAVIVRLFVEADIVAGRLQVLFEEPSDAGYHIVTRPGVLRPAAKAFVQWLRRQK